MYLMALALELAPQCKADQLAEYLRHAAVQRK